MAKVRQHDGDLYVSGNLRVLGGIQNVKNSETVTRLATSEAAITVVESTLTTAVDELAAIEVRPLFVTVYKRSVAYPDAPVGVAHTGWSIDIPTGTDPIYMSGAQVSFDGLALIGSWYAPVRFTNAATLTAILTNETHRVPTDIDGNFGNYAGAESKLEIYEGSVYVSGEFTMGYTASSGVTVDTAYFTANKIVRVTDMSVDSGYVDLSGVRAGTTITKRFSISKSKQGDAAPSYSISASTVVALVKPDGTINPPVINMSATYQVGTTPPQAYEAVFRFLVNGVEQFVPKAKQSLYAWSGFGDILIDDVSEILLYNTPDIILPFNYSGQDALAYMTVEIWSPIAGSVPGEWLPDVLLDSQSVTFIADWENYREDMLGEVPDFVPRYLGRFNSVMPTEYRKGDSWLVYDTDDQPYERGLYLYNGIDAPYRLTDAVGSTSGLIVEAMPDILWAVKNGYGDTAQYGAVTYIENLVSNAIFTERIQIGQDRVKDLGTTLSGIEGQITQSASGLQTQIDGKIETYYTDTDPNTWAEADRMKHTGDMWYATTAKTLKRYDGATNTWLLIEDQKAIDAYTNASTAQSTADGKLDVFNTRPTSGSYKTGDLWVDATAGKMYTCTVARDGSGWLETDWVLTGEDATGKTSTAQAAAELAAKDALAVELGYTSYANMVSTIGENKKTIIIGGYIQTSLIDVENLLVKKLDGATGRFTGSIEAGPMYLDVSTPASQYFTLNNKTALALIEEMYISNGIAPGSYPASGSYGATSLGKIDFGYSEIAQYLNTYDRVVSSVYADWAERYFNTFRPFTRSIPRQQIIDLAFYNTSLGIIYSCSGSYRPRSYWVAGTDYTLIETGSRTLTSDPVNNDDGINTMSPSGVMSNGSISITAGAFTFRLLNMPGYSPSLPVGTVYAESDGGSDFFLRIKG